MAYFTAYLTAHRLAHLSELMLVNRSPELGREFMKSARELVQIFERRMLKPGSKGTNVIDVSRRFRQRALMALLDTPDPPPPRRAA